MPGTRLSALDASFLTVESPTAHMHVGWASTFRPPEGRPRPTFAQLREHIAHRLSRAPRYRQKLASVPLGLHDPMWVDDESFDCSRHVLHTALDDLQDVVDMVMSVPLHRDRPLWEMWIADRLHDGRIGVVGKAHHCLVDGIAAVELSSLLLDPEPEPGPPDPDDWQPEPAPGPLDLVTGGVRDRVREELSLLSVPTRAVRSPKRLFAFAGDARRAAAALASSMVPPAPPSPLNEPGSGMRHLALVGRPLEDLRRVKRRYGTTVNDVLLAACAGAARRFLQRRGEQPVRLKTMVPVNIRNREQGAVGELGNHISFIFVELPCDREDPVERLIDVHRSTSMRKRSGLSHGGHLALQALTFAPRTVQHAASRLVSSSRAFNLTVSNIPGPREPMYMLGSRLEEAYPVVPIADRHALSIGMTTIGDGAYFGLYADRKTLPDADQFAGDLDTAIDELLAVAS